MKEVSDDAERRAADTLDQLRRLLNTVEQMGLVVVRGAACS